MVIELKKPGVPARAAFDENLTHYKRRDPALFWFNALLIASNGTDSRVGSLTADWDRFFEWKRIEREDEPRRVSLEVMLRGTCDRTRLLDLVENFTLFSEHKAGLVKILGQNHQFLGVNNAIASMLEARKLRPRARRRLLADPGQRQELLDGLLRAEGAAQGRRQLDLRGGHRPRRAGRPDRQDLQDRRRGVRGRGRSVPRLERRAPARAAARQPSLRLHADPQVPDAGSADATAPTSSCSPTRPTAASTTRWRSTCARRCRRRLFLAFTGTPLIAGEERTKEVFGDYVSIYDFQQSVEDGATVPLFYENRTPELQLDQSRSERRPLPPDRGRRASTTREAKLERELGRQYHLITRDDRLETVAEDIVRHFLGRGFIGKAMVVSIDKATALRMHDKVQEALGAETERVRKELGQLPTNRRMS